MQGAERSTVALVELANRLAPHMKGGAVPRSVLDHCFDSLNFGHALRLEAMDALATARITVIDDVPRAQPPEPERGARSEPVIPPVPRAATQQQDPVSAARRRLARDEALPDSRLPNILLSAEEEVGLALLARLDGKPLKPGQIAVLEGESRRAAAAFVLHNLRLAHSVCKGYVGQGLEYDDLVQSAVTGLLRAVELFDPAAGFKFSTYATYWVRQAVSRAIANEGRAVRLPVHMWEMVRRVVGTREQMLREDRRPTLSEIAKELDLSVEKVIECLRLAPGVVSLETPLGDDQFTLGDLVDAQADVPEHIEVHGLFPDDVERLLDGLSEREAYVIRMRYGLDPYDDTQTLDEIGKVYGVTRERTRQIEAKALSKIRKRLIQEGHEFPNIDPLTGKRRRADGPEPEEAERLPRSA